MSQQLATLNKMSRPYQTCRVGYDMPAMEFKNGTEVLEHSRALYARLHARPAPVVRVERSALPIAKPPVEKFEPAEGVPLDMLKQPSWRFLVAYAALLAGVRARDVIGKGRTRKVCTARHHSAYLIAGHLNVSLPRIGTYLGGRDHTTILHSLEKFPKLNRPNPKATGWQRVKPESVPSVKAAPAGKQNPFIEPAKPKQPLPDYKALHAAVVADYVAGMPVAEIAKKHGYAKRTVYWYVNRAKAVRPEGYVVPRKKKAAIAKPSAVKDAPRVKSKYDWNAIGHLVAPQIEEAA